VPCARIARQCARWELGPAEFFAGIPGTLGGALAMNAGAWGGETWRQVVAVETIDRRVVRRRAAASTRSATAIVAPAPGEWFVAATLSFERMRGRRRVDPRLLERRLASQPIGAWSCGSVFTNPPGDHAARLIESAG
jgi:UDP-N-acetylmuramate dehydrogenase